MRKNLGCLALGAGGHCDASVREASGSRARDGRARTVALGGGRHRRQSHPHPLPHRQAPRQTLRAQGRTLLHRLAHPGLVPGAGEVVDPVDLQCFLALAVMPCRHGRLEQIAHTDQVVGDQVQAEHCTDVLLTHSLKWRRTLNCYSFGEAFG